MSSLHKVILVHGCCEESEFFDEGPCSSNSHWFPWLQKQLVKAGMETQTPEMPKPYEPDYPQWKRLFDRCRVDAHTALAGHSCGAGFLVRWLTEKKTSPLRVVLVAPWLDPFRTRGAFLDFAPDPEIGARLNDVHILYSDNDVVEGVKESVETLSKLFPRAQYHRFRDKGHFTLKDLGTEAFPELLSLLTAPRPSSSNSRQRS